MSFGRGRLRSQKAPSAIRCIKTVRAVITTESDANVRKHLAP